MTGFLYITVDIKLYSALHKRLRIRNFKIYHQQKEMQKILNSNRTDIKDSGYMESTRHWHHHKLRNVACTIGLHKYIYQYQPTLKYQKYIRKRK